MASTETSVRRLVPQGSNPPRRRDLSWRHATPADLDRITWDTPIHRWSPKLGGTSHRARRVAAFYCALNRAGSVGYRGTRAAHVIVAAAVERASGEKCKRTTFCEAVKELVAVGFLRVSRGYGTRSVEIGEGRFVREPLAVITLTDEAIALWTDRPTSSHPVQNLNGSDQEAPSPPDKTGGEGSPTRASIARVRVSSGVETEEEPLRGAVEPRGRVAATMEPRPSPRPVEPLAELADGFEGTAQAACHPRRESYRRTQHPHGTASSTRRLAVSALLVTLGDVTKRRERVSKAVVARAAFEIAGGARRGEATGIDWDYWIARWPEMTRGERRHFARTELVPLLSRSSPAPGAGVVGSPPPATGIAAGRSTVPAVPSSGAASPEPVRPPDPPTPAGVEYRPPEPRTDLNADPKPENPYADFLRRALERLEK